MIQKPHVKLVFQSSHPWPESKQAKGLLGLLRDYDNVELAPERYGPSESRTFRLADLENKEIERIWQRVGGGIFKCKQPWNMSILVLYNKNPKARAVSLFVLRLDAEFFDDEGRTTRFLELCKDIYTWGRMDHGYVALEKEYIQKNNFGHGHGVGGANLKVALPGIYWANFFGPIYVNWFGHSRMESLKTFHKERLSDGGWMLVTRPSILQYKESALRTHEREIVRHLGQKAFFEMEDPRKPTITPNFWETL